MRRLAAIATLVAASGCDATAKFTPFASEPPPEPRAALPAADAMLRGNAVTSTTWLDPPGAPVGFDRTAEYAEAAAAATAFTVALEEALARAGAPSVITRELVAEDGERSVVLVSQTGLGDDSIAGVQYLLVLVRERDEWRVDEIWTRVMCLRGVGGNVCV